MNRGLPARHVVRYFDHVGEDWVVKPEMRQLCNFRQANLCTQLPFHHRFDVIFCERDALLLAGNRKTLLANAHGLLAPDGVLLLGSAEQPADPSLWTSGAGWRHLPLPAGAEERARPVVRRLPN